MAKERGLSVDEAGFATEREHAKDIARAAGADKFAGNYDAATNSRETFEALQAEGKLPEAGVNYNPYDALSLDTEIVAILREGELTGNAVKGERVEIVLRDTPFYVESGGQVSDTGLICDRVDAETEEEPGWCVAVKDTRRPVPGFIVHVCDVEWGAPQVGDPCTAQVDEARRWATMRNHTATHLLQKSLRVVLGSHVGQQGSLVAPDRLRFDFSHGNPLTRDELDQVSEMLNDAILDNLPVTAKSMPYKQAIESGAMAFFSEKYGDVVRVVNIGQQDDQPFSAELCGGTHVQLTGDIGSAMIVSEGAVSAGVRRIEVLTGRGVLEQARKQQRQLSEAARVLGGTPDNLAEQAGKLAGQLSETEKQLAQARRDLAKARFDELLDTAQAVNGARVLVAEVKADSADLMREMSDWFRGKYPSGAVVLGAVINDKPSLLVAVSQDLNQKGVDAGKIIKEIAAVVGGGGGGRPNLAQAGGKDPARLGEALEKARALLAHV